MGKIGRPGPTSESLKTLLEEAGFVDIEVHNYKQPIGPWPKDKKLKQVGAMVSFFPSFVGVEC